MSTVDGYMFQGPWTSLRVRPGRILRAEAGGLERRGRQNHLLALIPRAEAAGLYEHMELVSTRVGQVLFECGSRPEYVFFPTDAVVSLVSLSRDGSLAEVASVGNEGVVGTNLFLGDGVTTSRAVIQRGGRICRVKVQYLRQAFESSPVVRQQLLRYVQALFAQISQAVLCNRHHTVEQRLCRWLLSMLDRVGSDEMTLTQEMIANALGVRRSGVTEAAGELQRLGAIRYSRGNIKVIDRHCLEEHACECYGVVRLEYERLFPLTATPAANRSRDSSCASGRNFAT
jgi:CRP-like cAMP-binding protein